LDQLDQPLPFFTRTADQYEPCLTAFVVQVKVAALAVHRARVAPPLALEYRFAS
jgi:hypothetical protein